MNTKFFIAFLAICAVFAHAQLYYNAPTVASEYAWPAVGESAPYYSAGYAGIPVSGYYPYAYAYGSASKRSPQSVPQMPSAAFRN
uniref:Uncharacterized protein n=1 Tax=Panagrolaimus davidi TaxID=227884 RepID=A0A914PWB8_9BILA